MATRKTTRSSSRRASERRSGGSFVSFSLGFLLAAGVAGAGWFYLQRHQGLISHSLLAPSSAPPPVQRVPIPAVARADHELPKAPFGISEDVFEAGARTYSRRCASCHGTPDQESQATPKGLPLWSKDARSSKIGVAGKAPGEIFTQVKYGIKSTGMPAFKGVLTDTQIWQVSLLLNDADQPLPDPVSSLLVH